MQKIISVIMVICLMATIGMTATSALDTETMSWGTSTIQYTEMSRYSILIPEAIDMNGSYTFISAEMDLDSDEYVAVALANADANGCLTLTHTNGVDTAKKSIGYDYFNIGADKRNNLPQYCVGYFRDGDSSSRMSFYLNNNPNEKIKPGDYTGTAEFVVELKQDM